MAKLSHLRAVVLFCRYQRARDFYNYELGSSISVDHIAIKLAVIIEQAEKTWSEKRMKYRVYYAAPSSLIKEVQSSCFRLAPLLVHRLGRF